MKQMTVGCCSAMLMLMMTACNQPEVQNKQSTAAISPADIRYHVNYLASDLLEGRLSGTPGAEAAANYIAAEFNRFKLRPIGERGSYLQPFDFVGGVKLGPKNKLVVEGMPDTLKVGTDFIPAGFSSTGEISGSLAFVGYAISTPQNGYDDYANLAVADIVIALRYSPEAKNPHSVFQPMEALRYKTLQAREHGAKALLIVTGPQDDPEDVLPKLRYDRAGGDAGLLVAHITRKLADALLGANGESIASLQQAINTARQPKSMALSGRVTLATDVVKESRRAANVAALLEGRDATLRGEYVVIGAHYDHWGRSSEGVLDPEKENQIHNGADDNASGTAGVLELAQYFAAQPEKPKRSLVFLTFCGEELGLLGSAYYVGHPLQPLDKTVAMINMDMIGRVKDSTLVVEGVGTSPRFPEMMEQLNKSYGFKMTLKKGGYGPSDHQSFYSKNLPVLFFFTGMHEDYHRVSDDPEKINVAGEAAVVNLVAEAVMEIANAEPAPQFTKAASDSQPQARGFRVSLGTIPDYAAEVEGLAISGVRPGSSAEKAGLQSGDVIIKFGTFDIKNIYDYTYALSSYSPGDEVEIVALRAGNKLTVKAKLEARR